MNPLHSVSDPSFLFPHCSNAPSCVTFSGLAATSGCLNRASRATCSGVVPVCVAVRASPGNLPAPWCSDVAIGLGRRPGQYGAGNQTTAVLRGGSLRAIAHSAHVSRISSSLQLLPPARPFHPLSLSLSLHTQTHKRFTRALCWIARTAM